MRGVQDTVRDTGISDSREVSAIEADIVNYRYAVSFTDRGYKNPIARMNKMAEIMFDSVYELNAILNGQEVDK